jgi:hypothetical protein
VNSRRGCGDDREIEEEVRDGFGKGAREKSDCNVGGANAGTLWNKARGSQAILVEVLASWASGAM